MKKLLNKLKELYKKSSLFRIVVILLIWALLIFEWKNIYVDRYNFQQLEKAKKVVKNLKWEQKYYPADNLKSFNYQFDTNIEPLDKRYCYDVYYSYFTEKKDYTFTFWFKLHSLLYKLIYGWEYYNYPYKRKKPTESEQCKKARKAISNQPWIKWIPPSCVTRGSMEAVNNPCEKQ